MKKLVLSAFGLFVISIASAQTVTLPYNQDFEGSTFPPTGWQFFGSLGSPTWERNDSIGGYGNSSACAFFDNYSVNLAGNYFGMRAPMMNLTGNAHPYLIFDVAYARRNSTQSETLGLWYSINGTTGWTNITNYSNSSLTSAPDETDYFVPQNTEWRTIVRNLSAYANFSSIRFAFENNSDNGNVLYLDNVHFFDSSGVSIMDIDREASAYFLYQESGKVNLVKTNGDLNPKQVSIYNSIGQQLSINTTQATVNKLQFDLSGCLAAVYYVVITAENGKKISKKFILTN